MKTGSTGVGEGKGRKKARRFNRQRRFRGIPEGGEERYGGGGARIAFGGEKRRTVVHGGKGKIDRTLCTLLGKKRKRQTSVRLG